MSIIEEATRRLEQLERAGVEVPWAAARANARVETTVAKIAPPNAVFDVSGATGQVAGDAANVAWPARARPDPSSSLEINLGWLESEGYLVPARVRSQVAAEFRDLKRTLLKNARSQGTESRGRGALVVVTSAVPGEGKTFCAINLAMSMALEVDTAVLLVDADVVRPSVLTRLGVTRPNPLGLLDLLSRDDLPLHDALMSTNVPKFSIMAAGSRNERSPELLGSNAMSRLLDRLSTEYADHIVIFDAPPLLLASEASILANAAGQVVMVVEALRTPRHLVAKAYDVLRNCPAVLSVLNKCSDADENQRYANYYG